MFAARALAQYHQLARRIVGPWLLNSRTLRRSARMIHHVTHLVSPSSLDDCVRFYAFLGFRRVPEPAGITGRVVWLEHQGTQIHLMPEAGLAPAGSGAVSGAATGHVAVVVDEYEATVAALRGAGHRVQARREHWGAPRAYVHDPAGHTVELMAWAPGGGAAVGESDEPGGRGPG